MSYVSEMIKHAVPNKWYSTGVTPDELYDAWRDSGRDAFYNIAVVQSQVDGALDFRITKREDVKGDEPELLTVALCLSGITLIGCILIGWGLS